MRLNLSKLSLQILKSKLYQHDKLPVINRMKAVPVSSSFTTGKWVSARSLRLSSIGVISTLGSLGIAQVACAEPVSY